MTTEAIDDELARTLGAAVASHSHEELPAARIDELDELTTAVAEALEDEDPSKAAGLLLGFWTGHVSRELGLESTPDSRDAVAERFEEGFDAGTLGVDLYQALSKVAVAAENGESTPDLGGWTDRLFELTNRHVAHLESHQHDS